LVETFIICEDIITKLITSISQFYYSGGIKIYKINNKEILITFLNLFFVLTISVSCVSASNDTVSENNTTSEYTNYTMDTNISNSSYALAAAGGEGGGDQHDYANYETWLLQITKINGQNYQPYNMIYINNRENLTVEAKLSEESAWGTVNAPWRYLNFYITKGFNGALSGSEVQIIWKREGVITNLFTAKASVTIDTSSLTFGSYNLVVTYNCEANTVYYSYIHDPFYYADVYTTVFATPIVGDPITDENSTGNNNTTESNNTLVGNNNSENNISGVSVNASTVPMQNTGSPIGLLVLGLIALITGNIYNRIK
jgi:hypothetical protein